MDIKEAFSILNIEETKDTRAIKNAYLSLLKQTNPEEKQEEFIQLRTAYETADKYSKEQQQAVILSLTPMDELINQVEAVYEDITKRRDFRMWEEIIRQDICESLDTSDEALRRILAFLMDHYYLPDSVWRLLDQHFQIIEQEKQLKEVFHEDFINYVVSRIQNNSFLPYDGFVIQGTITNVDEWIKQYYVLKGLLDEDKKETNNLENELNTLLSFQIYHPYQEIEQIRVRRRLYPNQQSSQDQLKQLLNENPEDNYVGCMIGEEFFLQNNYDMAKDIWSQVLKRAPQHIFCMLHMAELDFLAGEYKQSKEQVMDVLELDYFNEDAKQLLHRIDEKMIPEFLSKMESLRDEEREKEALELGWCYYEDEQKEECVKLLDQEIHKLRDGYTFQNLMSRVLVQLEEFQRAEPIINQWIFMIENCENESEEEQKKRKNRYSLACYINGICLGNLEKWDKCFFFFDKAVNLIEDNKQDLLLYLERKAYFLLKSKRLEECIDVCERILAIQSNYYPAMLHEMEAYNQLHKLQPLMDMFYRSLNVVLNYPRPYVLAVRALYYCNYLDEVKDILNIVKENDVQSDTVSFFAAMSRSNTKDERELDQILEEYERLLYRSNAKESDLEDISEVWCEKALIHRKKKEIQAAIDSYQKAIEINPKPHYYWNLADTYEVKEDYDSQLKVLLKIFDSLENNADYLYDLGRCYCNKNIVKKGLAHLQKAIQIEPDNFKILDFLYQHYSKVYHLYHKKTDYDFVLSYAIEEVRISPTTYSYINLGLIYMDGYQLDKALESYNKALELDENEFYAHNNIGYTYEIMRDIDPAINQLQICKKNETVNDMLPYFNLARCYVLKQDWEQAHKTYQEIRQRTNQPTRGLFMELLLCLDYGNLTLGLDIVQRMLSSNIQYGYREYYYISRLYEQLMDEKNRKKYFQKAIKCNMQIPYLMRLQHLFDDGLQGKALKSAISIYMNKVLDMMSDCKHSKQWCSGLLVQIMSESGFQLVARSIAQKYRRKYDRFQDSDEHIFYPDMQKNRLFYEIVQFICIGHIEDAKARVELMKEQHACTICRKMECYRYYEAMALIAFEEKRYEEGIQYLEESKRIAPQIKRYSKLIEKYKRQLKR